MFLRNVGSKKAFQNTVWFNVCVLYLVRSILEIVLCIYQETSFSCIFDMVWLLISDNAVVKSGHKQWKKYFYVWFWYLYWYYIKEKTCNLFNFGAIYPNVWKIIDQIVKEINQHCRFYLQYLQYVLFLGICHDLMPNTKTQNSENGHGSWHRFCFHFHLVSQHAVHASALYFEALPCSHQAQKTCTVSHAAYCKN